MAMQFDMSGGSNDFSGNDSPDEDRMDVDDDYQPPRSSFEEISAKEAGRWHSQNQTSSAQSSSCRGKFSSSATENGTRNP
jgi:hypothetical protein